MISLMLVSDDNLSARMLSSNKNVICKDLY